MYAPTSKAFLDEIDSIFVFVYCIIYMMYFRTRVCLLFQTDSKKSCVFACVLPVHVSLRVLSGARALSLECVCAHFLYEYNNACIKRVCQQQQSEFLQYDDDDNVEN